MILISNNLVDLWEMIIDTRNQHGKVADNKIIIIILNFNKTEQTTNILW